MSKIDLYRKEYIVTLPDEREVEFNYSQIRVVELLKDGKNRDEISQELGILPATVNSHFSKIRGRIGVNSSQNLQFLLKDVKIEEKPSPVEKIDEAFHAQRAATIRNNDQPIGIIIFDQSAFDLEMHFLSGSPNTQDQNLVHIIMKYVAMYDLTDRELLSVADVEADYQKSWGNYNYLKEERFYAMEKISKDLNIVFEKGKVKKLKNNSLSEDIAIAIDQAITDFCKQSLFKDPFFSELAKT